MANARQAFATPNWSWLYEIESETVHGCDSGLAVATARFVRPSTNTDAHFAFTMYLVREHGKWTVAADNVTINQILPGMFDTDRLRGGFPYEAQVTGSTPEAIAEARKSSVPARRFGDPAEFGALCAFLCSVHAGYITGQNILIDGGQFPGAF